MFEDRFETAKVDPLWIQLRTLGEFWYRSAVGGKPGMEIEARKATIYERGNPSYMCRWLTSRSFDVETTVEFSPRTADDLAGLALVQNECNNYVLGKTMDADGKACAALVRCDKNGRRVVASDPVADGVVSFRAEGREKEILVLVSKGCSNTEIGDMLHLSPNTVKNHLKNLFESLGAADRAEAVAIGIRRGLIS